MNWREECEAAADYIAENYSWICYKAGDIQRDNARDTIERISIAFAERAVRAALKSRPQMTYKSAPQKRIATFGEGADLFGFDRGAIEVAMYDDDASVTAAIEAAKGDK